MQSNGFVRLFEFHRHLPVLFLHFDEELGRRSFVTESLNVFRQNPRLTRFFMTCVSRRLQVTGTLRSRERACAAMTQLASHRELALFKRVAEIIESARGRVARSVNSAMVQAYWLIGREIVEIEKQGKKRAGYG